jgi:hypothetical protein
MKGYPRPKRQFADLDTCFAEVAIFHESSRKPCPADGENIRIRFPNVGVLVTRSGSLAGANPLQWQHHLLFPLKLMRQIILSLLLVHLAACSSMQTVPVQDLQRQGESGSLQIGDRVELLTDNKEKLDFAVTDITADGLGGKFGFIPYTDIRRLRIHRPAHYSAENATWLWGVLGVAALIALLSTADSVTVCSGAPCPPPNPSQ